MAYTRAPQVSDTKDLLTQATPKSYQSENEYKKAGNAEEISSKSNQAKKK